MRWLCYSRVHDCNGRPAMVSTVHNGRRTIKSLPSRAMGARNRKKHAFLIEDAKLTVPFISRPEDLL